MAAELSESSCPKVEQRKKAEEKGEEGLKQAHELLGHQPKPGFIKRYHGPDGMTQSPKNKLTEWEVKATNNNYFSPAKDINGYKQGSAAKNKKRGGTMAKKKKKLGQDSNEKSRRIGGPYEEEEIELWEDIQKRKGKKKHMIVHVNTSTGLVRVFEQYDDGEVISKDPMENFYLS